MTTKQLLNPINVKRLAGIYFIGLATINIAMTWYNFGIKFPDIITILLAILPFAINRKMVYLAFGFLVTLICSYLFVALLIVSFSPNKQNSPGDLIIGFLLVITTLLFSLGLMHVGMQSKDKGRFSLI